MKSHTFSMKSAPHLYLQPRQTSTTNNGGQNHHHRSTSARGGDDQTRLLPGRVVLRLLCHVNTAGGVIGNSGGIIKQLETLTGTKIRFEEPLPNCSERVVNVIGEAVIDRKVSLNLEASGPENEEDAFEVSRVQEGLFRVFHRIIDLEWKDHSIIACRLLGGKGQIGAVMGKGGAIVDAIRRNSGAKIRVLNEGQVPASAAPEEQVIQITGDARAVKTALLSVSRRLQDCTPAARLRTSDWTMQEVHSDSLQRESIIQPSYSEKFGGHTSVGAVSVADVQKTLSRHEESTQQKVVFRLLCSNNIAGGVIGAGATVVKALEKETGASIKFSCPVSGSDDRVVTISSFEIPEPLHSSAQTATVRVFARSVEVSIKQRLLPSLNEGEAVTAGILVAPNEIKCLMNDKGKVAWDISDTCGVEIGLIPATSCASENDKVVQISGKYENVNKALFQITGRLRDRLFSGTTAEESKSTFHPYSVVQDNRSHGEKITDSLVHQLDYLNFDHKHKDMGEGGLRRSNASRVGVHENRVVEVKVPENVFPNVYGENGSNLARIKEISGATVILHDPSPGECDGKVIISGTPDRILVAQSLLQAFLLT